MTWRDGTGLEATCLRQAFAPHAQLVVERNYNTVKDAGERLSASAGKLERRASFRSWDTR